MSDKMSQGMSDKMSEWMSEGMSDHVSDKMSDVMSEAISEKMSDDMSEGTSGKMLESRWAWVAQNNESCSATCGPWLCTMKMRCVCF